MTDGDGLVGALEQARTDENLRGMPVSIVLLGGTYLIDTAYEFKTLVFDERTIASELWLTSRNGKAEIIGRQLTGRRVLQSATVTATGQSGSGELGSGADSIDGSSGDADVVGDASATESGSGSYFAVNESGSGNLADLDGANFSPPSSPPPTFATYNSSKYASGFPGSYPIVTIRHLSRVNLVNIDFGGNENAPAVRTFNGYLEVRQCTFSNNLEDSAMHVDGGSVEVSDTTFIANVAGTSDGGGIRATAGKLTIANSTFSHNEARRGSAVSVFGDATSVRIIRTEIFNNIANQSGALYTAGG